MTKSAFNLPIRAIALAMLVTAIGCNPEDELTGWNDWGCPEIYGDVTPEQAKELAIEYEHSDYQYLVSQHGEPIDEGYFVSGGYDPQHDYIFLFDNTNQGQNTRICHCINLDGSCGQTGESCWHDIMTIEDCDYCASDMTRIE